MLEEAAERQARRYPGAPTSRQPVHSVYVPAHQVDRDLVRDWAAAAERSVARAGGIEHLLAVHGLIDDADERSAVGELVLAKLRREPIEDLRIDFEDGYGAVADETEDAAVDGAVETIDALRQDAQLPPFVGIRFKSLEPPTKARGLRTLERFVAGLAALGPLPAGLVLTLPKVTSVAQVEAMVLVLTELESALGLPDRLEFEIQVETPQAILGPDGVSLLPQMIAAGDGRITGMPYGTYDYSAALGIAAGDQSMAHPAADFAKAVMQVAAAGTAVRLSDGSTNVLPIGSADEVDAAWALHGRLVSRSLHNGFYQGWDLHPAQLPSRFAATYAYFRRGLPELARRLAAYLGDGGGAILDEPATARAMAAFLLRGIDCGAVGPEEVPFPDTALRGIVANGPK
ncbi:citrate lyase beta subunit [Tamaricihabitans halophyticus]|uniref:Citrate lyase beta subunit n=2 Tax=Tamaricihabitans halophyticus TaxID=1262583 RepID=A0A4R2R504_9PSEU|nr:citrate lyase beta subunit [Tamaricihabitans halophyticus]